MLTFNSPYQGSGPKIQSFNPATGELLGEVKSFTLAEAREALARARVAQKRWAQTPLAQRLDVLTRFQYILTRRAEDLCELISRENGKPLQEAMITEVLPIIDLTAYFVKRAPKILAKTSIPLHLVKYRRSYLDYRPRGVMLVISPWNFPFTIPAGTIVMGLIAGNSIVHKPASLTPLIALKLQELFLEAGLDQDLYQVVPASGSTAFELIGKGVDYVNFTGSTSVGLKVSERCGAHLIPCSMELGGKDPAIVREDANLDFAAGSIVWGAFANAGQVCASVERVYAHERIYDRLLEKIVERTRALRVGDPLSSDVDVGAMVDAGQLQIVENQVNDARAKGARILCGGNRLPGPGLFFEPTVLVDVTPDMDVVKEETFGPLLPVMSYRNDEEAIALANDSIYGLNAYVFTRNPDKGRWVAERLEAGTVMINEVLITHGLPETPWQGVKLSGTGKVHSDQGLRDLCYPYHINEDTVAQPSVNFFWPPYSHAMYRRLLGAARSLFAKGAAARWEGLKGLISGK